MSPTTSGQAPGAGAEAEATASKCPVDHSTREAWLAQTGGNSPPHPFHGAQSSSTAQRPASLSTERTTSSIPRHLDSGSPAPADADASGNWVYPSPSQFFSAMQRKNHNPKAEDMDVIVPIHNAVNERAWTQILEWERLASQADASGGRTCPGGPKLVNFIGRPRDRTPRAWWKTLTGYRPPFDRHDWLVDRCGTRIRYVIDFYSGRSSPSGGGGQGTDGKVPMPVAFYLDVRPALDGWEGVKLRTLWWARRWGLWSGENERERGM